MSVDQLPPGKARPAKSAAQFVRYGEFIDQQIESTRRTVKVVDVLTALLTIVVGTLAFLLVAAVVEHWLLPGGYNVALRLVLFVLLFTCLTFYTTRKLWPLVRGSINPAYAAQAIEQDNPTLKNSLLNLLLFRQHRDDVTDAVYETLEEQAAKRLHRVPVEAAVDRTPLLRLGYALIAVLSIVALYKILSPKDPFTSAERVLMPWARIAAPSRVSIENIEPGHVTLARGETLTVAADVRGIGADDPVVVKYTTADGQSVDRPAAMKPDAANLRFTGKIPPEGDLSLGVAQDLRYYLEAGDARSLEYKVTVVSAPTITVERVEYDYPEYTGFTDRSIERLGDIRAIEGTRVTIHTRANQSIDEAAIDFQADGRRDLSLTAEGEQARTTFTLELREDRETPKYTSYVLRFTGSDGRPNLNPVKHPIDVVPDIRPEAAILAPQEKARDVRLNETVDIEIEARDPDFALSDVRVTGESAGRTVFDAQLLAKSHNGRFVGRLAFTPAEHELHAGDVVRYWVTVRDNRTPQANESTTDSQTFRIVGPDARQPAQPPRDRLAQREQPQQRDPQQPQNEQQGQEQDQQSSEDQSSQDQLSEGQSGQSSGESGGQSADGQQGENQESGESSSSEGNAGDSGEQGSADQSNENGQGENSQNQSGEQRSGGESGDVGESSTSEQGGQAGQGEQRPGGKQESGGNLAGDPQEGSSDGAQAGSQSPQENGQGSQNDAQRGGENAAARNARERNDSSPVSSDGDNDGEAFERIQEFLKEQGQLPKESPQQQGESEQSNRENGAPDEGQNQEAGESSERESSEGEAQSKQPDSTGRQQEETGSAADNGSTSDNERGAEESSAETGQQSGEDSQHDNTSRESGGEQPGAESPAGRDSQAGAETQPGAADQKSSEPAEQQKQQQPGGGQKTQSEGESGAGNQAEQGKAPPDSLGEDSTEKWQQDPSGKNEGEQPQRPDAGRGERKSDSHGEQGGEHTGAAEENNAKKSERDGTGSSGQNQSTDEGMGESSEQGAGRNSTSGGQDAQANKQTGQSSESMQGEGSQQRDGQGDSPGGQQGGEEAQQREQQGKSPGGEQGEQREGSSAQPGQEQAQQGESGQQQQPPQSGGEQGASDRKEGSDDDAAGEKQNEQPNEQQGAPRPGSNASDGAGRVPQGVMQPGGATGEAPGADAANLEYARKQTDLVLETLAEQMKRQKVDKRLLDKLGWTEAELKRFVDRWQQLKAAAEANNPEANEAQRELDDALRSLGLRRGVLRQSTVTDDQNRNLRQGYRGPIPLEYQERLRAYNQGISRARQSDE